MKLAELLRDAGVVTMSGEMEREITAVTADSRQCGQGSLFVAIPGTLRDGADFVSAAIAKGASAVVSEREVTADHAVVIRVRDAREALSRIASNFFGRPADTISLVGVTGTSGKTTTTKMIESIFEATGDPVGLIGTIEYRAGGIREIADRTTPDAVVLQRWFATMVDEGVKRGVMEVSSHALAQKRTAGITFAAAVFTNLSRDHLDYHADMEDYFAAKRILFDQIDRSKRSAVVNLDDEFGRRLAEELGASAITFGRSTGADIHPLEGFEVSVRGLRGRVSTPAGEVRIESPLIGFPNLSNWMAAIGAAIAVGVDVAAIERGVAAVESVRGRFERVGPEAGATFIVDYAHKPDALEKLLSTTRQLAPERSIILVFGCGGDRDQGKRAVMGEIAARLADHVIITSDNPRSEDPKTIIAQIEEGVRAGGSTDYEVMPDRRAAIGHAVDLADDRSIVLVAGKGHENYQVVADQILHFDDREELELAIRKKASINS